MDPFQAMEVREAFDWLNSYLNVLNQFEIIYPDAYPIGTVIEATLGHAMASGEPSGSWLEIQKNKARRQRTTRMFDSIDEFVDAFTKRFIPEQFKYIMREDLKKIKLNSFNTTREFLETFDAEEEKLDLIGSRCTPEEMYEILKDSLSRNHLEKLTMIHTGEKEMIRDYQSLRSALFNEARNQETLQVFDVRRTNQIKAANIDRNRFSVPRGNSSRSKSYKGKSYTFSNINEQSSEEDSDTSTCSSEDDEQNKMCYAMTDCLLYNLRHSQNASTRGTAKKIATTLRRIEGSDKKQNCYHCNQEGHFVRDCPKLGGSGNSTVGSKTGTAAGFRANDDPNKKPFHYRKAVKQQVRDRANVLQKRLNGKSKNKNTHAQRLKRDGVSNPQDTQYNLTNSISINEGQDIETLHKIEELLTSDVLESYARMSIDEKAIMIDSDEDTDTEDDDE